MVQNHYDFTGGFGSYGCHVQSPSGQSFRFLSKVVKEKKLGGGGRGEGEPGHEARPEEHLHPPQQASRTIMKLTMSSVSSRVTRKEGRRSPKYGRV